jgi:Fe-S cluster assembly protein SufD
VLVFVNGHFSFPLSRTAALPKKLVLSNLKDAMKNYGSFLNNQWAKSIKEETDPFAALNAAMHQEGAFIYLPPKTIVEAPLQILHVVDMGDEPMLAMPRLHLFAGSQSQINLYSNQAILSGNSYFINAAVECSIEEEAHVKYIQAAFEEPADAWHFDAFRATLKRNSTLKTISATDGGPGLRFDYRVALAGENAEAMLNGTWLLGGKAEAHTHVIMDHQSPYCRSMQLYKGVLNDFSHSSFEGKILVRQAAQKTEAFQLNNNLLLSDRAAADSKPNLEIFADDVKASHGATVGQLDKEQLFYMKTRGFSLHEAQNILVKGFCKEVVDMIPLHSLASNINQRMERYLSKES